MEGNVKAAIPLISDDYQGRQLALDSPITPDDPSVTVRDILRKKHPKKQHPKASTIVESNPSLTDPHPVLFNMIDSSLIRGTVLRMNGAAGPSGLDAAAWKRMCTSFKQTSIDLCDAIASITKRLLIQRA